MPSPSIINVLIREHQELSRLMKQALATTEKAASKRSDIWSRIFDVLTIHAEFEEQSIYPLLMTDKTGKEVREGTLEAVEEHAQIKALLREISDTPVTDERWKAKLTVLAEDVHHHVKEEEQRDGLFDNLRSATDTDTLKELGRMYQAEQEEMLLGRAR